MVSKNKLRIFKGIAFALPVMLLLFIEAALRLFHYGHDTRLFISYPDDTSKWVMNKYASEKYFSDTVNATHGYIEPFDVYKKPGTLRIFVLGESTAAGYPYFHNGSFHRWLYYRLIHTFPDKKIELVNLALTAVNSYTVLDFSKEVVKYQPDAVLVYVGHNEYYGALGVASTSHIGGNYYFVQTMLWLRQFKLVQLLNNTIYNFKTAAAGKGTDNRENLMKRMAARQEIPYGGDDYNKGLSQYQNNMDRVCQVFAEKHIPVLISNLVSNERDLKPFISDPEKAAQSANKQFKQADSDYQAGDFVKAKKEYIQAKEYDLLRFRAPDTLNQVIKNLTVKYPEVHLVDTRVVFEQHSPHGILGKETLLEHVHPNLYGYALMSEAFYQSLKRYKIIQPDSTQEISFEQLLHDMPVTKVDSLFGAYQVMMLKSQWPFSEQLSPDFKMGRSIEEQIAGPLVVNNVTWGQANDALFKNAMKTGDKRTALKATEAALLNSPGNILYYTYAARLNFELADFKAAEFYFKKAYEIDASFSNAQNLYLYYIKTDKPENAMLYLDKAIEKNGSARNLSVYKNILADLVSQKQLLNKPNADKININAKIAADYQSFNETALADKYRENK